MPTRTAPTSFVLLAVALLCGAPAPTARAADAQFFETKVRPLLVDRCYNCHSHAQGKDKGGLYVDSREALLTGGDTGPAIAPGEPAKSKLIEAVSYHNVDLQMPPKGKLTDQQVADLTEWVKQGAPWPAGDKSTATKSTAFDLAGRKAEHWAWQPIKSPPLPPVKNAEWVASPIDRFVLARLEAAGLAPAPQADRRTLIRRATLLITGLPPTPTDVDAFLADASPDAFATVVDRLLASPAYGERWARHWLDVVRFAETRGHEFDYVIPNAYQYRDYVIRAFNADVPYDQFVREHVAGDLLPEPRMSADGVVNESVIATGFWFLNEWVHSPVDIRQDEVERVDNQVDVFAKAFNGLTLGCARCHDHKFDAISAKDYYALAGFMHSSSFRDVRFEHQSHNADVARRLRALDRATTAKLSAELDKATRPAVDRLADYMLAAADILRGEAVDAEAQKLDRATLDAWVAEFRRVEREGGGPVSYLVKAARYKDFAKQNVLGAALRPLVIGGGYKTMPEWGERVLTVIDHSTAKGQDWIVDGPAFGDGPMPGGTAAPGASADRPLDVLTTESAAIAGLGAKLGVVPGMLRTPSFIITEGKLSIRHVGSGQAFVCVDSHRMIEGPLHKQTKLSLIARDGDYSIASVDLKQYIGQRAHVEFTPATDGSRLAIEWVKQGPDTVAPEVDDRQDWRWHQQARSLDELAEQYAAQLGRAWLDLLAGPGADDDKPFSGLRGRQVRWLAGRLNLLGYDAAARQRCAALLDEHRAAQKAIRAELRPSATAMAMLDGSPFDEHVLIRGQHKTPGELAPRRYLEAIDGVAPIVSEKGSGRLKLADRLIDPANPLTSRVMVNRVWHHLFGRGIVASTDNFGVLGEQPTHPQLLDHLAADFMADGWSVKWLIREIVLSKTWQMSSSAGGAGDEADPQNLLLHRQNLRRLEGEAIRDQMLAISGRLDARMYGPGVEVYLTPFMDGRGRPGKSGPLDGGNRRSIYTMVRRNYLSPMMLAFDTPQPFNTMGRRSVSNVPAQALILMNDPFVVEEAGWWAKRVLADKSLATADQRIKAMYTAAFAREPTVEEQSMAASFLRSQGDALGLVEGNRDEDPRVWAELAHALMNVKEFLYVP